MPNKKNIQIVPKKPLPTIKLDTAWAMHRVVWRIADAIMHKNTMPEHFRGYLAMWEMFDRDGIWIIPENPQQIGAFLNTAQGAVECGILREERMIFTIPYNTMIWLQQTAPELVRGIEEGRRRELMEKLFEGKAIIE